MKPTKAQIRNAVYAHIQALRTLGRKKTYSHEIAQTLGISWQQATDACNSLKEQGVIPGAGAFDMSKTAKRND